MNVTFTAKTALFLTRALRSASKHTARRHRRCNLIVRDNTPGKRMTFKRWREVIRELSGCEFDDDVVSIASDTKTNRPHSAHISSIVYERRDALPAMSFVRVSDGVAISGPELLFVELARELPLAELLLVGFELCGGFSRDAVNPRCGDVVFGVAPATSTERIEAFLDQARWLRGASAAREALGYLSDNAWSPTEAVAAIMASLPLVEYGYELGPCVLNKRVHAPGNLARAVSKSSRVPDILFAGTRVGLNYDGAVHLDLESVANAGSEFGSNPGDLASRLALEEAMRQVRAKVVDDIRRGRELAAGGYVVFPITKEDLYEQGAFDRIMLQVMAAIEQFDGRDFGRQRRIVAMPAFQAGRQELLWSLIPGDGEARSARMRRMQLRSGPPEITELEIGF